MDNGQSCYSRYLSGDDLAMTELVCSYKDGLTMYLCSIVGDLGEAEDLTEETFFRLAYKKPRFSGQSTFKTWLYSIGRNTAAATNIITAMMALVVRSPAFARSW